MDPLAVADARPAVSLVSDATVYTGGRWLTHTDVHIADGVVTAITEHDSRSAPGALDATGTLDATATLDAAGAHVVPGFVNTHTHLQQSLMRGLGEGRPLLDWLIEIGDHTAAITPERAYLAAVAACLDGLRSGTTTLVEHMWPHPSDEVHDAVVRALEDTGVRALLGRGCADRADATRVWGMDPRVLQPLGEVFDHADRLAARTAGSRIRIGLAVPNPRCVTPDGMAAIREYSDTRGATVSIHLLETTTDDDRCREHTGRSAVEYLGDNDFLWDRLIAAHCVRLDGDGRSALAEHGVAVSYNPLSNMRLGSGVAPLGEWLRAGIDVGLGVDGAASNDTQDMLETMRIGAYVQRAVHARADLFPFAEMLDLATGGAAGALGHVPHVGGVTVGAPADLTLVRFDRDFGALPVHDPGATMLTTGSSRTVDTVLVGGEIVVEDGHSTRIDDAELVARLTDPAIGGHA
ncbi:amidohydrolase [Rhodococcus rhodnii]|nr:amidohydrolase family protein [Rhodococcus rhodnii]TXG89224.1 amidohydrolase [Rhodococcus rhodnii]